MKKRNIKFVLIIISILICNITIFSCDSSYFVYLDEKTFQKQVSNLKDAYVVIVYEVDPTKKNGYRPNDTSTPWPVIRENRFNERNKTSDELCHLILRIVKRNDKDTSKNWHPTYQIYVKYTVPYLYFFETEKYFIFNLDFKNRKLFTNGIDFIINADEANLIENKLVELLNLKKTGSQK